MIVEDYEIMESTVFKAGENLLNYLIKSLRENRAS